jgi:hypothetical protein
MKKNVQYLTLMVFISLILQNALVSAETKLLKPSDFDFEHNVVDSLKNIYPNDVFNYLDSKGDSIEYKELLNNIGTIQIVSSEGKKLLELSFLDERRNPGQKQWQHNGHLDIIHPQEWQLTE